MTIDALLSLGGNLGDRKALADSAVARLAALPGTSLRARSSYYRTEPVGPVEQAWFLNIAVALRTAMPVEALVAACRAIEAGLGRDRSAEISWGPRTIDIDVVALAESSDAPAMRAADGWSARAFVLVPLAEIAPAVVIDGLPVADRLAAIAVAGVERLDWPVPAV